MELQARLEAARAGYREDFAAWADAQASLMHAGRYQDIDWPSVIEEIEGLAGGERRALSSQLHRIQVHLLKLMHSPTADPRNGWQVTIVDARNEIEELIETSPSLAREIEAMIAKVLPRAVRVVLKSLEVYGELTPAVSAAVKAQRFTRDQILGDWFPDV